MRFEGKTIVVISQQDWGKMFVSKHHYAVQLAALGNKVYFLNSPEKGDNLKKGEVLIESTDYDNLYSVKHRFFYPYVLKHRAKWLHAILLKFHIKKVVERISTKVDVVWSFDLSNAISLISFPKGSFNIYMPVDEPKMPEGQAAIDGADVLLSVTREILDKYKSNLPKLFVNHGVAESFFKDKVARNNSKIQVGLSGNFLRQDIDWHTLLTVVSANSNVQFNFWGPLRLNEANIAGAAYDNTSEYRQQLIKNANVTMHGVVTPQTLAESIHNMDCFFICYDIEKDHSKGTNYHKILEYLATGKVVVANNTTTYADRPDLLVMPKERNNTKLPELFVKVINNIATYNAQELVEKRIAYAREHTYLNNVRKIETFINSL